jgi:hypothetical protein
MTALTGQTPASTYKDLLQVSNSNSGIDGTLRPIEDGEGSASTLSLSTTTASVAGDLTVTNDLLLASSGGVIDFNSGDVTITHSSNLLTMASGRLIMQESSTGQTANLDADAFVLERSGTVGMSFLSPNTSNNFIMFGDTDDDDVGQIKYNHNSDEMSFVVNTNTSLTIDSSNNVDCAGTLSVNSINMEQTVNAQTGTTYTLVAADNRKLITFSNAADITVTLPQQSTLTTAAGFTCKFLNIGVGTVTFVKEGSETLIGNTLAATNAGGSIERPSTTSWEVFGGTAVVNSPALGPVILSVTTSNTKIVGIVQANCTLLGFSQRCFSIGTAGTYDIQLNGVDITGLTGIVPVTAGSVESVTTATNLVAGDVISIVADGTLATIADLLLVPNFTETF